MRAALPDPAVRNHLVFSVNSLPLVQLFQRFERFERAIFIRGLRPGNVRRLGNMSRALRRLAHPWRRDNLPGEFVHRPHIHELSSLAPFHHRRDFFFTRANRFVPVRRAIRRRRHLRCFRVQRPLFFEPLLPSAVDQPHLLVPIVFQLPKRIRRKPVVIVAIEQDGRIVRNPRRAQQPLQLRLLNQVAPHVVLELRLPVPAHRAGNVPLIKRGRVHVHFHKPDLRVV